MGKIFFLGDSIAAGAFCENGGWATQLANHIISLTIESKNKGNGFYCFPYNLSIEGDNVQDVVNRFDNEISVRLEENEKCCFVIALGTNDSVVYEKNLEPKFTDEEYKNNLSILINKCRKYSNNIVFVGQIPIYLKDLDKNYWHNELVFRNDKIKHFNDLNKDFCFNNNIQFIDIFDKHQNWIELLDDGLHPNSSGHEIIYKAIKSEFINDDFVECFTEYELLS